jgi:hypothetical protein
VNTIQYKEEIEDRVMKEYKKQHPDEGCVVLGELDVNQVVCMLFLSIKRLEGDPMDIRDLQDDEPSRLIT